MQADNLAISMTRVAIPSISFCQTESLRRAVLEKYPDTRFNQEARRMTDDELVVFLSDRDAAIMGLENLTAEMLDQLPELKIISRMGVGLDNVLIQPCCETAGSVWAGRAAPTADPSRS